MANVPRKPVPMPVCLPVFFLLATG
jgi:hypothetical protein